MITIEHCKEDQIKLRPRRLVAIEMTRKEWREGLHSYSYLAGEDPPHFPVPMIPIEFQWTIRKDGTLCLIGWDVSREVGTLPEYKINSYGG